ncbi:hypothetical protein MTO96_032481 [Rhipicephalus appendiculatus]
MQFVRSNAPTTKGLLISLIRLARQLTASLGHLHYRPVYRASVLDIVRYRMRRRRTWYWLLFLIGVLSFLTAMQRPFDGLFRRRAGVPTWLRPRDSRSKDCTNVDVEARFDCHP